MRGFVRMIDRISNVFGVIAGIFMILGMVLVLTEVVARFFNKTIYITGEYTAYFMVAITFLGLAYTLKEKGHIRMTFLHNLKIFKSGKVRAYLEMYTLLIGFILFSIITVVTAQYFWDSVVTDTRSMQVSQTPLAIPQFAMPLGSLLITLQFVAEFFRSIIHIQTGEFPEEEDAESEALGR